MENAFYREQRNIERFILLLYSMYIFALIAVSFHREWDSWVWFFMLLGVACCWGVYIGRYKDYLFRARFSAVMMQTGIILYASHVEDLLSALPVFISIVIFLGLYGITEIIYMTGLSAAFLFFYHSIILHTIPYDTAEQVIGAVMRMANIFFTIYIISFWVKKRNVSRQQMLDVIEELKEAESSKDDFLANVSHEIRTPINTICGMSEIVLREKIPPKIKENVLNMQIAGRNLKAVVSDIVDFSELQSGKLELEEEAYNITSTINDVINMTMARKSEKKLELVVDCDANIPCALLGDEKKLRRVIMNLTDNAIKFTNEGCVSINVGFRKEAYGINLIVTVKDTGIGMKEESLEKLFSSFNQVDSRRNRQKGGIGLGLAISQALVQKMGGAITVKSKWGKGSSIRFVVPQKVLDESPIVSVQDREKISAAVYIDLEQFSMSAIRDEYSNNIIHMVEQLKTKCHICRNLAELQRREEKEHFTHIFISLAEYRGNSEYFDSLAQKTKVIVVIDRFEEKYVQNPNLLRVYKPFYILTIVSVLNGSYDEGNTRCPVYAERFVTRNVHVLVVDDNSMNIRVIEGLLDCYWIKVTKANSGREALEKITSMDYDFIFMDHMMPEMDGVETLHCIRKKVGSYYQKVPVIALTANAVAGTREMLLKEGFSDFLEKPIERSVLERVLKRNLPADKIVITKDIPEAEAAGRNVGAAPDSSRENAEVAPDGSRENAGAVSDGSRGGSEASSGGMERSAGEAGMEQTGKRGCSGSSAQDWEKELAVDGLDIKKGILYCNGMEQYIKVLQGYCQDGADTVQLTEQLFEKKDWKNYTIAVHGMKSAMHSIGALRLAELAKQLELAGKEGRIDYIQQHHGEMTAEYNRIFSELRKKKVLCPEEDNIQVQQEKKQAEKQEGTRDKEYGGAQEEPALLEDAVFEQKITELEDVMYALDGDRLLEIISELQKYKYHGVSLRELMVPVKRKVEMSDYVSAVEMVVRLKNSLAG